MDILSNLQNLLGAVEGGGGGRTGSAAPAGAGGGGAGGLFSPEILGGLATALLGAKAGRGGMGGGAGAGALGGLLGSLLGGGVGGTGGMGGGGGLLDGALGGLLGGSGVGGGGGVDREAMDRVMGGAGGGRSGVDPLSSSGRALRVMRALVFAAKADGHVDEGEERAIRGQLEKLNVGSEGRALVDRAMGEPLDPKLVAAGVVDMNEAVGLYALSCAITGMDHFMERSYLDGLASALGIPSEAKSRIEAKVHGSR